MMEFVWAIVAAALISFAAGYLFQICAAITKLSLNEFGSKKEFISWIIPLNPLVSMIIEKYRGLE